MSIEGEKFLLKLYQNLDKQDSVLYAEKRSGKNSKDKYEKLKKYLDRLQKQEMLFDGEHKELEQFIKNRYYDKYVIKEENIPESHWLLKQKIDGIDYTEEKKHEEAQKIINNQKESLEVWIDYLMKEKAYYPMWARYWAFQGMLKLGNYDKQKNRYLKRSKKTISAFAELDAEALSKTIEIVMQYVDKNVIDDDYLESLIQNGSFGQIYAYVSWKLAVEYQNQIASENNDGVWKKYTQNDDKKLVNDLKGKKTRWCITTLRTIKDYFDEGCEFEIYYTKDNNDSYTMPRICIRTQDGKLAEIRGLLTFQNVEPELVDVITNKINEFPEHEAFRKAAVDMKRLNDLSNKKDISKDDMKFLFEYDNAISYFGMLPDPRIDDIRDEHTITDFDVAKRVITNNDENFKYLDNGFKANKQYALELVECNKYVYWRLNQSLKEDLDIALKAVASDSIILRFAPQVIRNDEKTLLSAIAIHPSAIQYAGSELLEKTDFIIKALEVNPDVYGFIPEEYKKGLDLLIENGDDFNART